VQDEEKDKYFCLWRPLFKNNKLDHCWVGGASCRHDSLSAKCQFAVKGDVVGKKTQLFSTAFQLVHFVCACKSETAATPSLM